MLRPNSGGVCWGVLWSWMTRRIVGGMDCPSSQSTISQTGGTARVPDPGLDWIADGFLAINKNLYVLHANRAACRILERPSEKLIGQHVLDLFDGLERKYIEKLLSQPPAGDQTERLVVPIRHDGRICQFELTLYPNPEGLGVLLRDVSEWLNQERKIAELNATLIASQELLRRKNDEMNVSLEQLERLNHQLEEMDRAKNEFLAVTSHELRTPLNSIIGFMQLIMEGLCENREEEMSYLDNALTSARRLLAMINDVLDIAKLEAGKMTLVIGDLEVEEVFQDVGITLNVQAQRRGLSLSFSTDEPGMRVRADAQKTRQVLINLVGNALKFTNEGSVMVRAGHDESRPDLIKFTITDTGIGIPPHYIERIFDKFMQVDPTSTRRYEGTGLGLTITRNLVEMMGGAVEAFSEGENMGTTMVFTLPAGGVQPVAHNGVEMAPADMDALLPSTF